MSSAPIIERTKTVLETGQWWSIPWWRDEIYFKDGFASRETAETAFCELKELFDAKWMLAQRTNDNTAFLHPIANKLINEEGLASFQFFYELGINLHTARVADLIGDIKRRLRNREEYWEAAIFELAFLSRLIRNQYKVEPNYRSRKGRHNCDFKVSKESETVFVEIKRPWVLSDQTQQNIGQALSDLYTKLLNDDIKKEEDVTSLRLFAKSEIDRVFRLIRYAVNNQIPEEGPGVVIVESPHALNWNEFALTAEKRFQGRKNYSALSAVILIRTLFQCGKICNNSRIVFNSRANIDIRSSAVLKLLRNANGEEDTITNQSG